MNTRSHTRRLTSTLGGVALAIGAVTLGVFAPAAQAAPVVAGSGSVLAGPAVTAPFLTETGTGCTVSEATLNWGVLERWRAYITGTIANGDWTLNDGAEYETPAFRWPSGSGEIADDITGKVSFAGGIHFSGHDGLLQLTVANPVFELVSPSEGYLLLDLSSTKQTGEPDVSLPGVRAVKIDLDGAITADGTTLEVTEAPGMLTAEGASAFGGFYSAGEAVDPINLTASAPGCVLEAGTSEASEPSASEAEVEVQPIAAQEDPEIPWLPICIGAVALLVIGVAAGLLLRGRKPAAAGAADVEAGTAGSGTDGEAPTDTNA